MQTDIYLIRHGEVANPKGVFYGRLTRFTLSRKGRMEIEITADYLIDKNIHAVFSSPLLRARQSAEIIRKKLNLPRIHISQHLLEIKSSFQGKKWEFLNSIDYDFYFSDQRLKGDESMEEVRSRMKKSIGYMAKRYQGKNIVAVSHGDPIMILKTSIEHDSLELRAIRENMQYIKHGEVLHINVENNAIKRIESVFTPNL